MNEKKTILPKRSRRYGVGKEIGGAVYLHRCYEHLLGAPIIEAKQYLPPDFVYDLVKYHVRSGVTSFIQSPDFDSNPEPTLGDIWTISGDGRARLRRRLDDPYIYHHKWLFVTDDYAGFNVKESKARSLAWIGLLDVDRSRIGRRSYWSANVESRL